jgi:hypothetical protein
MASVEANGAGEVTWVIMEFSRFMTPLRTSPAMSACPIPVLSAVTTPSDAPARAVTDGEQAGLLQALSRVPDPRSPRGGRYPLAGLLTVAVCAVMAGASSFTAIADWLHDLDDIARARLSFVRGVPATTTMWRLLILDADLLATILAGWLQTRTRPPAASRRPRYRRTDGSQVHLLSALDTSTCIVLAQVTITSPSACRSPPRLLPLTPGGGVAATSPANGRTKDLG